MKEKIVDVVDTAMLLGRRLPGPVRDEAQVVAVEFYTNQILTLLQEEIEKMENPFRNVYLPYEPRKFEVVTALNEGFEQCRQKSLTLLSRYKES